MQKKPEARKKDQLKTGRREDSIIAWIDKFLPAAVIGGIDFKLLLPHRKRWLSPSLDSPFSLIIFCFFGSGSFLGGITSNYYGLRSSLYIVNVGLKRTIRIAIIKPYHAGVYAVM